MIKKNKCFGSLLVVLIIISMLVVGCGGQTTNKEDVKDEQKSSEKAQSQGTKQVYTLKLGHTGTPETSITEVYETFKQIVEEKSQGQIKIDIHPGGALGGDIELMESVKLGTVDIGSTSQGNFGAVSQVFLPMDLPYIIPTMQDWERLMTGKLGDKLIKMVEENDHMKVLFIMNAGGMRHIMNNKKPVKVPADAKGLKLRAVGSPVEQANQEAWGITATPVAWPETYSAVEQRVVDGLHNPYMWTYIAKIHENIDYVTETGSTPVIHLAVMNLDKFNSLPSDLQAILNEASKEAAKKAWQIDQQYSDRCKQVFKDKGIEIYTPTPKEMEQWMQATKVVWEKFAGKFDPEVIKLVEEALGNPVWKDWYKN